MFSLFHLFIVLPAFVCVSCLFDYLPRPDWFHLFLPGVLSVCVPLTLCQFAPSVKRSRPSLWFACVSGCLLCFPLLDLTCYWVLFFSCSLQDLSGCRTAISGFDLGLPHRPLSFVPFSVWINHLTAPSLSLKSAFGSNLILLVKPDFTGVTATRSRAFANSAASYQFLGRIN